MSRETPNGTKLEDLLAIIQADLVVKTSLLEDDDCPVSREIRENNEKIVALLNEAETIQRDTMTRLAEVGEDNGPYAEPRVGK
jgi:hypothetical protein